MGRSYRFEQSQFLALPRPQVFEFFSDATNLEAITPDFLRFKILTPRPIVIQYGTLIDYRLQLFGVPFYWRTRIDAFDPPHSFADVQLRGPYRRWHHRHEFHEAPGGTEMQDIVDYELPLGPLGAVAHGLFVRRSLVRIFAYRRMQIEKLLGGVGDERGSTVANRLNETGD